MIDVESKIFKIIYDAAMAHSDKIYVTTESAIAPPSFPAVYVNFKDNYVPARFSVSSRKEIYAAVTVDVEVYTNSPSGKRAEAKSILSDIDAVLAVNGFRRSMMNYTDLTDNRNSSVSNRNQSIIRLLGRYEVLVDQNGNFYSRR